MDKITPEIPKGMRDFFPEDMAKRRYVMEKIRGVFELFGYDAIETPSVEYARTLFGKYGAEGSKLTYGFKDHGGRDLALRYDQTVPFARFVAANYHDLPMPFKRYQISRVWRADKPAKGRFREFHQCDIDIIGTDNLLAEGEVACVMAKVFESLGFTDFTIKFNSRRFINGFLDACGVNLADHIPCIRILDKVGKLDLGKVRKLLGEIVSGEAAEKLLSLAEISGSNRQKIEALGSHPVAEIRDFMEILGNYNLSEKNLAFDPCLARGLDYYTGLVFEASLAGVSVGAVCAGGRYDDLCSTFCEEKFSGVGAAFGFDRIVMAMEETGLLGHASANTEVLVTYFNPDTLGDSLSVLKNLRDSGINAELYFQPDKISKQVKYADKKGIPFVVLCGPEESSRGEAAIKAMKTGKQKVIPQNQLSVYFRGFL